VENVNFNFVVLVQRAIELLALYLVLANMNGQGLKKALKWLWTNGQWIFYDKIIVFIGYVVIMTLIISTSRDLGHDIAHILTPFVGLFLVRKSDLRQGLLGIIFVILVSGVTMIPRVLFTYHTLINFGLLLIAVIWLIHRNYVYTVYEFLKKQKVWFNFVTIVALVLYSVPFFSTSERLGLLVTGLILIFSGILILFDVLTRKGIEKEVAKTIDLIFNSSYDELLEILEKRSEDYAHSEYIHHFIIDEKRSSPKLVDAISEKLKTFEEEGLFRNYVCQVVDEQVKISVVL